MADLLPLFPLGTVLFPGLLLPLQVFEPRYRTLMADLTRGPEPWSFGIVAIREGHEVGTESVKSLYDVGCTAVIQQIEQLPDGRFALVVAGGQRFKVVQLHDPRPYLEAEVVALDEPGTDEVSDLSATVREQFADYCTGLGAPMAAANVPEDAQGLAYVIAATMMLPLADRQALLELGTAAQRLRAESGLLARELALMRTGTMPVAQPRLPPYSQN